MELKPETDREIYISLNNEVRNLRESIERFGTQLMNLESIKFSNHELRIEALEKIEQERKGMWKFMVGISLFLSILLSIVAFKTVFK